MTPSKDNLLFQIKVLEASLALEAEPIVRQPAKRTQVVYYQEPPGIIDSLVPALIGGILGAWIF
jgi:hypothetical protein